MDNKNPIFYCINNQVHFFPQQNKLISCKTGKAFITYVTASRCLHLLICQSGNMVSHHALYAAGWENHGKIVTLIRFIKLSLSYGSNCRMPD